MVRERIRTPVVIGALTASLSVGWISATAARAAGTHAHSALFQGKIDCSSSTAFPRSGSVNFSRSGDILTVSYRLRNGLPNRSYQVELYVTSGGCPFAYWDLPTRTADARGALNDVFTQDVSGYDHFMLVLCACSVPIEFDLSIPVVLP